MFERRRLILLDFPPQQLGFPFIFWPVFWPNNYYGSRVYGPANNDTRPGGEQTLYVLAPPAGVDTTDGANNFALYGDANSVDAVWTTLQSGCGVGDQLAANYSINPNQTVQWYRGSSFALLLEVCVLSERIADTRCHCC